MDPIFTPIVAMLAKEGLGLLAGAVAGGKEKTVKLIEKKTGIDIKDIANPETDTILTSDQITTLRRLETESAIDLASLVAGSDKEKGWSIIVAAIAPEIPEMVLFGMGLAAIIGLLVAKRFQDAMTLAGTWFGAIAMYVKGK